MASDGVMTWTDGYISDVSYPAFFYKEMQPVWLAATARFRGFSAPDTDGSFELCELGCGAGINLLTSAACHPSARFLGVDFDAGQLEVARHAARSCGIENVEFLNADFATFAAENERHFDFITSHGAWSWIAPHHREALLEGAARALEPGGLFYLHYMCHPGSTDLVPLQHLLNLCAHHMPGPSPRRAQTGLKLLRQIADSGIYADQPAMLRHLANMEKRDPADLAHEFLTDHWQPQQSASVHEQVGRSGLSYIGSADAFANLDVSLSVPGQMQALIRRTHVPALAETLKDMARNAHQRMDLFQKEPAPLNREQFNEAIAETVFQLLPDAPRHGPVRFSTPIGPVVGPEEIFTPLLQRLSAGMASGAELLQLPAFAGETEALLQAVQLLMMQGMAHPVRSGSQPAGDSTSRLSRWFADHGIGLAIIEDCATTVPASPAG